MSDEAAFLAAIASAPEDDTARLVFADWLQENGDPRAPWVRNRLVRSFMGPRCEDPVPAMVAALTSGKRFVDARRAARAIGAHAVAGLSQLLTRETPKVREWAAKCLGAIGPTGREALPALLAALKDTERSVRRAAITAIRDIQPRELADTTALQNALRDEDWTVRSRAEQLLGKLGAKSVAAEQFIGNLDDDDPAIRRDVVGSLGLLGTEESVTAICRAASDRDPNVREAAARQLGQVKQQRNEVIGPLRKLCRDRATQVRRTAAFSLAELRTEAAPAVPELLANLKHADEEVRWRSARALGLSGVQTDEVFLALLELLAESGQDYGNWVIEALDSWPRLTGSALPVLLAYLERIGGSVYHQRYAMPLLGRIDAPAGAVLPTLLAALRSNEEWITRAASDALGQLGDEAAVPELVAAVHRESGRSNAAEALARIGRSGLAALIELLADESAEVVAAAVHGLSHAGSKTGASVVPRLRELLRQLTAEHPQLNQQSYWRAKSLVEALQAIGPSATEAIPDMLPLFRERTYFAPRLVAGALRSFGWEAVLPYLPRLMEVMRDPTCSRGHSELAFALRMLGWQKPAFAEALREPLRGAMLALVDWPENQKQQYRAVVYPILVGALGSLGPVGTDAVPDLLSLIALPGADAKLLGDVVTALGQIQSPAAVPELRRMLVEGEEAVRAKAAESLALLGEVSEPVVASLMEALTDRGPRVRKATADALGQLCPEGAAVRDALKRAMEDADKGVRDRAGVALRKVEKRRSVGNKTAK
ncbi:MAG: HEAT repeat domain-containing protein [Planctomycetes bacterium]|nr:HEAT repeat domain-containing protein [Planctomycetota bacterium]